MIFMKLHEQEGFTLIELLIVIAILGILAAAAAPKFVSYKAQADANSCKNNLSTIETALEQYMFDHPTATAYPTTYNSTTLTSLKNTPACPSGGNYAAGTVSGTVACSLGTTGFGGYSHQR